MSVGIVIVSHSRPLAEAALNLAAIMIHGPMPKVVLAAGLPDGEFGTDATAVMAAIEEVGEDRPVVVLVDMGSAVLSAETAIELLGAPAHVRIAAAPLVEGLTAALLASAMGGSLDDVLAAAESSLDAKLGALGRASADLEDASSKLRRPAHVADVQLTCAAGLHARPAARLASLVAGFEATVRIAREEGVLVNAKSTVSLMALGAVRGDTMHIEAEGPQADAALAAVVAFLREEE